MPKAFRLAASRYFDDCAGMDIIAQVPSTGSGFDINFLNFSDDQGAAFPVSLTVTGPSKTIYLAGIDRKARRLVRSLPGQFLEQWPLRLRQGEEMLAAQGATMGDIVRATVYVTASGCATTTRNAKRRRPG